MAIGEKSVDESA